MLYVTTRSRNDAFTAHRTMIYDRAPDGGLFVPMRLPKYERAQIRDLAKKSFGQNVADILNLFLSAKISGWDVDMAIGRRPVRFQSMNHKLLVAELWNEMDPTFSRRLRTLAERIHPDRECIGPHTDWMDISIRIAMLFGMFGELIRTEQASADRPISIAVSTGNFAAPMAAWYGRQMGLPIGTIICGCNENSAVWDLLHHGEMYTDVLAEDTATPECDYAVPPDLERLICGCCGHEETMRFRWSCAEGGCYTPPTDAYKAIRQGMFAAVVSGVRMETIIPSVYRTNQYILDPYAALAYGALSDHRARTGSGETVLLLSEKSPMHSAQAVAKMLRMDVTELKKRLSEV